MSENIRLGFVGYGDFAAYCRKAWSIVEGLEIVAVADKRKHVIPDDLKGFDDWKPLVTSDCVDLIVISTPPSTHAEIAKAALLAGKNVLVEKPPAMNSDELLELLGASEASGKLICVDYMLRFNPVVEALKKVCETGVLGKLQHVSVANYAYDGKLGPDHWFWDKKVSGGILVEHAVHFFDMVSYVWTAKPLLVTGHAVSRKPGMEDKVVATVEYEDGLIGTHYHHFFRPWWFERQSFRFAFDLGEIDIEGWIPLSANVRALTNGDSEETLKSIFAGANLSQSEIDVDHVTAGGTNYDVDGMTTLEFEVDQPKPEVYNYCLIAAMKDLVKALQNPGYQPRHALVSCTSSVRIAAAGAEFAAGSSAIRL